MDISLEMLQDWDESEKERKARATVEAKGGKKVVHGIREKMNQTIRERRAQEKQQESSPSPQAEGSESSQSASTATKTRHQEDHVTESDRVFTPQRRTVDRMIKTLQDGDKQAMDKINTNMDRYERVEDRKMQIMEDYVQMERERGGGKQLEKFEERMTALEGQHQELKEEIREQGRKTDENMAAILAILRQR